MGPRPGSSKLGFCARRAGRVRSRSSDRARTGRAAAQTTRPRPPGTAVTAPQLTRSTASCRSAASAEVALEASAQRQSMHLDRDRERRGHRGHRGGPRAARWAASKHAKLSSPHEPTLARPPRLSPPHGLQSPSSASALWVANGRTCHRSTTRSHKARLTKGYVGVLQSTSPRFIGPSAGPVRSHRAQCRSAVAALHRRAGSSTSIPRRSSSRT